MLLPPPIVIRLVDESAWSAPACVRPSDPASPPPPWTPYVTPAATWPRASQPITIAAAGGAPPGIDALGVDLALRLAAPQWTLPSCTSARIIVGSPIDAASGMSADGINEVVVHALDWPSTLTPLALAQTVIFTSGTDVLEADIHVNAHDWSFSMKPNGEGGSIWDLRAVLTHELGHVFGVGHSADARATMHAGLPGGLAGRSLEPDDVAAICALYPGSAWPEAPSVGCVLAACPSGTRCVGRSCEWVGELSTLGSACDPVEKAHRCEAAGDAVDCVATSEGDRCATGCMLDDAGGDCGANLACFRGARGSWCVPIGASLVDDPGGADAMSDARSEGGSDAGVQSSTRSSSGCGVARSTRPNCDDSSANAIGLALAALIAQRRRGFRARVECSAR